MDWASPPPGIPIPRKRQRFQELARAHPSAPRRRGAAVRPEDTVQKADQPPGRFRFGVFEADPGTGQLLKQGRRLRLQEQPFRLLVVLLERPGELVTREELHRLLWPRTTIDFDHGLNKAVSKLRDALGDSAESPRFVETVARRGYRCLADVAVLGAEGRIHGRSATGQAKRICTSLPSSLSSAWSGVRKPRHFRGLRSWLSTISCGSASLSASRSRSRGRSRRSRPFAFSTAPFCQDA